jgi:hypothetical protein
MFSLPLTRAMEGGIDQLEIYTARAREEVWILLPEGRISARSTSLTRLEI